MTDLQIGTKAPDFNLSLGGEPQTLTGLEGRPVVVFFYPRAGTPGCTNEVTEFSKRYGEFAAIGVEVVGISPDAPAKLARFRDKHGLHVHLASDEGLEIAKAWGVWVEKQMYGRRYMGVERATFLVDSKGTIAALWRKVKVAGHVEEVLATARALGGARGDA
ncbi:peroxiredoxin [Arvimicrobium flavum]|uniref:peroxiredoxin n=1 Tax=Arvimicrobium flavum TaxID=3393320 RepID=UPI00237ABF56|nr:peroxiredoxin [Mesorhizobium shangrilense]